MKELDQILSKLADLVQQGRFEEMETDGLEIKPVPSNTGDWKERFKSANAFLNTRGGILILGIKEEQRGNDRRYVFTDWHAHAENKLADLKKTFTDEEGTTLDLSDRFPAPEIRPFLSGHLAIVYIDELPADRKFVFYEGSAYKRVLTGDHKVSIAELNAQKEFRNAASQAKELQPVPSLTLNDLDLTKLNHFIFQLNQPIQVETIKPDLTSAESFLQRRFFIKEKTVTILGALVCAQHPAATLEFRCHVHAYVDFPAGPNAADSKIVQDKQDFVDNVLQLMEQSFGYLLRNTQVGISTRQSGSPESQYPSSLLRETINNALAHRDYSINRQVIVTVTPGVHITIQNPGTFPPQLLREFPHDPIPLLRLLPEAKPRNPKLADVLRVYRKWEGRGIGMATLVNLCLRNQIDIPYYRLLSEEVRLHLQEGKLLDDEMESLFDSFDGFIQSRLTGNQLTLEQKLVLSYLIKSERLNTQKSAHTILLSPDNNHFDALSGLERAKLVSRHPRSEPHYPIFVVAREFLTSDYSHELRGLFGFGFDSINPLHKEILNVVYRFNHFSSRKVATAKQTSFALWYQQQQNRADIKQFDAFYRKIRMAFNALEKSGHVRKLKQPQGYELNANYLLSHLV